MEHLWDNPLHFIFTEEQMIVSVESEGELPGVDNGDLRRSETFTGHKLPTHPGKALVIVQFTRMAGKMSVKSVSTSIQIHFLWGYKMHVDTSIVILFSFINIYI